MQNLSESWFLHEDHRSRELDRSIWVPVYGVHYPIEEKNYPEIGHIQEFLHIKAALVDLTSLAASEELDIHNFLSRNQKPYVSRDGVFHEGNKLVRRNAEIGFFFISAHEFDGAEDCEISVDPDFLLALGLWREGDKWLRPSEGYDEVIRATRNDEGVVTLVEVKAEYLKDYLNARRCALRVCSYRDRRAILSHAPQFNIPSDNIISSETHDRCELRCTELNANGGVPGESWHMLKISRTDINPADDLPEFSTSTEENTSSQTTIRTTASHVDRYLIQGEMWRGEWVNPAEKSLRIIEGKSDEIHSVSIDEAGTIVPLSSLKNQSVGKYLWFEPSLVEALLSKRNSSLIWYTEQTGGLAASPVGPNTHFGVNDLGKINVFAYDVACLPLWQKRIWVSHNCTPDGGVATELLDAQQATNPAGTYAPEFLFWNALDWLDKNIEDRFGKKLFKDHHEVDQLRGRIHRFRGVNEEGLRLLAKDITKASIERLDIGTLRAAQRENPDKDRGSLKLLENLLAEYTDEDFARSWLAPLHGAYNLRMASAHLASSDVEDCYSNLRVDRTAPTIVQASQMLKSVSEAFGTTGTQLRPKKSA